MAENAISTVFNRPGIAGFTLLRSGVKFPPIEEGWQKKGHSFEEATAHRGNIGLLAGNGYIGLDKDKPEAFNGLILSSTTTWETRPGRLGMWFKCNDRTPEVLTKYGFKKPDLAQIKLYDGRNIIDGYHPHIGEIKLERTYQVIPPSWKIVEGQRVDYKMLEEVPPAEISLDWLLSELLRIGIAFSEKPKARRYEANAKKLEGRKKDAATRKQDKTAKAREFLLEAALRAIPGHRNDAGFWLACQLRDLGLQPGEASEYLRKFAISLDDQKGEPYTQAEAMESVEQAYSREPRDPPKRQIEEQAGDLLERIKADPRALKDPAILAALAALKTNDPIEYDLLIDLIKRAHRGLKVDTIHALIDKYVLESEKTKENPQDIPSDIAQAAQVIIDDGTAYEHIYKIWQKRVKGNAYLGKALLVSRGVQSCLNSKGLHIYAHGKHGHGKSEGMEKMIELVPPEFRMDEDVSPLAIHYASKNGMLLPGTTLLIDEMVWNDSLAGIIKRIITRFQKGAGHLTVIDGESVLVRTQPRLTIWTNSADLQADEQLRDRFQDAPITEGEDYVKDIIEFQKIRDTLPDSSEDVDRENAICQAILRNLATKTFTVKIPFATRIKIEASEGTRGYNIFSDLIKGLAAMRYAQRKTNEQGQLLATEADFKDAKDIYEGSKGHSEESYTTAEIRVLQAIIDHGYKALYKDIRSITGMSEGRIKDIVNGRGKDEQKRHGLRYKCSQLDVNTVDISIVIKGTYSDRVTTHPIELSLPSTFNVNSGIRRNLVTLDPDVERRNPDVDTDVDDIDSSRDGDVVDVVEEKSKKEENTSKSSMPSVERSIPSSKEKGQKLRHLRRGRAR
ncbi:MAG: hypothetical protein WCW68_07335 [Methanothrix sp.]